MLRSAVRTAALYLALFCGIRFLGKRELGQMEPSEFVVAMMMADLATIPVAEPGEPLISGLLPIGIIIGLEILMSLLSARSVRFRKLLCGKPVILIENGKILQRNLRRNRITPDELSGQLRLKDVLDISTVQYAIMETNGALSVFPYPSCQPASAKEAKIPVRKQHLPVTVIQNGRLLSQNLPLIKKDGGWVERVLASHCATVSDTFLLTADEADHILWIGKE